MTNGESIGQRIRRERLLREMTQRKLAELVGVGVPHISKVEADRESPSDELLVKIATAFDLDPDELLLVARRVPDHVLEEMASRPGEALEFLRTWVRQKPKPAKPNTGGG